MEHIVKIVIMSHLSDAEEILTNFPDNIATAAKHINFSKRLILKYPDLNTKVEEEELNEIWNQN